jgi:hypothetical protein
MSTLASRHISQRDGAAAKPEIRNSKSEGNPNNECRKREQGQNVRRTRNVSRIIVWSLMHPAGWNGVGADMPAGWKTAPNMNQLNDFHSMFHADRIPVRITHSPMKNPR